MCVGHLAYEEHPLDTFHAPTVCIRDSLNNYFRLLHSEWTKIVKLGKRATDKLQN